jgi:hypothetical protein
MHMQATHTCNVDYPGLPTTATNGHMFQSMAHPLISIPVLCDHDCEAMFTKHDLTITRHGHTILTGTRDPTTRMWTLPLESHMSPPSTQLSTHLEPPPQANNIQTFATKNDLATFLHGTAGYPVPSTWIEAIQAGNYATWPGLTTQLIHNHLPKSGATVKGHMQQQRKNTRSTWSQPNVTAPTPTPITNEPRTDHVFAAIVDTTGRIATDLTGRFLSPPVVATNTSF